MKAFMDKDFLLSSEAAKTLYHEYAAKMPIVDYHCHINPADIAADRQFDNIAQAWLEGDHYKWRLMRACGVEFSYASLFCIFASIKHKVAHAEYSFRICS